MVLLSRSRQNEFLVADGVRGGLLGFVLEGTLFFNGSLNTGCPLNVSLGRSVLNTKDETSQGY